MKQKKSSPDLTGFYHWRKRFFWCSKVLDTDESKVLYLWSYLVPATASCSLSNHSIPWLYKVDPNISPTFIDEEPKPRWSPISKFTQLVTEMGWEAGLWLWSYVLTVMWGPRRVLRYLVDGEKWAVPGASITCMLFPSKLAQNSSCEEVKRSGSYGCHTDFCFLGRGDLLTKAPWAEV